MCVEFVVPEAATCGRSGKPEPTSTREDAMQAVPCTYRRPAPELEWAGTTAAVQEEMRGVTRNRPARDPGPSTRHDSGTDSDWRRNGAIAGKGGRKPARSVPARSFRGTSAARTGSRVPGMAARTPRRRWPVDTAAVDLELDVDASAGCRGSQARRAGAAMGGQARLRRVPDPSRARHAGRSPRRRPPCRRTSPDHPGRAR